MDLLNKFIYGDHFNLKIKDSSFECGLLRICKLNATHQK